MEAHQRLAAVTDPLKKQQDNAVHIGHHRIGRDSGISAVGHCAAVDEQQDNIRGHSQAERRQAGGQDLPDERTLREKIPTVEEAHFAQQKQNARQRGDRLTDDGGERRARYAQLKSGHKPGVKHDIGHKAAHHREHCQQRRLVIAQHRGKAGGQNLKDGAEDDDADIVGGSLQHLAPCAEQSQQGAVAQQQSPEDKQAGDQQQEQGVAQQGALFSGVVPAAGYRERDGATHADAGAHRLDQRGERIRDIDGRQADISGTASDEKAVDNCIKSRESKRQHGRKDKAPEFFEHNYLHRRCRSRRRPKGDRFITAIYNGFSSRCQAFSYRYGFLRGGRTLRRIRRNWCPCGILWPN